MKLRLIINSNLKKLAITATAAFLGSCATRYVDVPDNDCYCAPTDKIDNYQNFVIVEQASGDTIYNIKTNGFVVQHILRDDQYIADTTFVGLPTKPTPEDTPEEPNSRVHFSFNRNEQLCRKFKFGEADDLNVKRFFYTTYKLRELNKPPSPQ